MRKTEPLALFGGRPVRTEDFPFPPFPILDKQEEKAVLDTLHEGVLSGFVAAPGEAFLGGPRVQAFEKEFAHTLRVKYAVAVNSATAALHCAVAAARVGFGDEVIVPPWTMSATATSVLMVNAIPVFADVDKQTYCLDPESVEKSITKYTKAIIIVHLFGRPAAMDKIMQIARKHKLVVIEDAAQAPLATYKGKLVGTMGDMGIFSFTASKQMTTGEGGMIVTNNARLTQRCQWMRNHGEVLGEIKKRDEMVGILGCNYRITEIDAAIGCIQLRKLPRWIKKRNENASYLKDQLGGVKFLEFPMIKKGFSHSFFAYPVQFKQEIAGIHRDLFAKALQAEGIPTPVGYVKPLYWNPVYRWKVFYGRTQFPYSVHPRKIDYPKGLCPVSEKLHRDVVMNTAWVHPKLSKKDLNDIVRAVRKVSAHISKLREQTTS